MNTKVMALICCLLTAVLFTCAQEKKIKPKDFKYGKVNPAEFEIKPAGKDSAASAVVIFDVGRGWFELNPKTGDFMYVMERHTRYKIFNKEGYDYSNLELELYKKNGAESTLVQMDGATYTMENGKMTIDKINKESKFTEKQDKNYT